MSTPKTDNQTAKASPRLIVAVSSRALFDLEESNRIFETEGESGYARYQIEHEDLQLHPGVAFSMVKKLLALNTAEHPQQVEVVLASRNSADTGLRVFRSIEAHGLPIQRAAFTRGRAPWRYLRDFGAHLFLSAHPEDVREALSTGIAAAGELLIDGIGNSVGGRTRLPVAEAQHLTRHEGTVLKIVQPVAGFIAAIR
jgi:hypothetical protein